MNSQANLSLLRQVLTFLGALLAGRGLVTADQATTLANDFTVVVPAAVSIGSIAWSIYAHWRQVKVPEKTVVVPPDGNGEMHAVTAVKAGLLS